MIFVSVAVEGYTDRVVASKLIDNTGAHIAQFVVADGKTRLDPKIPGLNRSGAGMNWLILRDLDRDDCAPGLLRTLLGGVALSPRVCLRIAVRKVESWLLADKKGFSQAFAVSLHRLPDNPDSLEDPKRVLVDLCRKSRSKRVRDDMLPAPNGRRQVGPGYESRIADFVRDTWNLRSAAKQSPSLGRTVANLQHLVSQRIWA